MQARTARIYAKLAEPNQEINNSEFIEMINNQIKPPEKLSWDQVYIRAMYIVSDEVNSFGGRFPLEEFEHLSQLLIDAPVMVGHRKDKLPIGRNFYSKIEIKDNRYWIKTYFYWLKNSDFSETLKENIDGGVYKECSIGFTFYLAECSICKKDIRTCNHEPFKIYNSEKCYFNYRQIEKVLETSIVYRGAVPNTLITNKLKLSENNNEINSNSFSDYNSELLVFPNYDGMFLSIQKEENIISYFEDESKRLSYDLIDNLISDIDGEFQTRKAILVGYRGKERCCYEHLVRYLQKKSSPVTHLELKILPVVKNEQLRILNTCQPNKIHLIKYAYSSLEKIAKDSNMLATKNGALVWDRKSSFVRNKLTAEQANNNSYEIFKNENSDHLLKLNFTGYSVCFQILSDKLLTEKKKIFCIINRTTLSEIKNLQLVSCGKINNFQIDKTSIKMNLQGSLSGEYVIRPLIVKGLARQAFYKI